MTLTIPQGGVIAGRAANAAAMPVDEPQTGALLADLGDAITTKMERVKAERADLTLQQTNLDMARDLGQARLEVDQISDPDQLDQTWKERSQAIYAQRVASIEDPGVRQRAELAWQEMNDRQALAVGNRAIGLTQSQRGAQWVEMKTAITAEASTADPETFGIYLEQGLAAIDTRLARGDLTPEEAAKERQSLASDMYASRATQAITADPDAFLAAAEAGEYNALGGDQLTRFRTSATNEKVRRAEAAAKAADQQLEQQRRSIKARLTQQTDIFDAGLSATDEALLTDPNVMAIVGTDPELQQAHAKAMAAKSLRDEKPAIRQMTPAQLRAEIATERATPKDQPFQAERVAVLEGWLANAETEFQSDGIKAARAAGLPVPVPVLPALDPANPAPLAEAINQRLGFDGWQRKQGYDAPQAILSAEEQAQLKAVLDPKADVPQKLALAEAVAKGAGRDARRVTGLIGADPVFNRAVRIVQDSGDRDLAAQILTGQQKEALGTVSLPPKKDRQLIFAEVTGGAFSANSATEAEIMETASALYAAEAAGIDPDGERGLFKDDTEAQDRFATAVARVTGARPDRNGELTIGGLQEVNGARVVLPKGVAREAVENAWDNIDRQLRGGVWDERYQSWSFAGEVADPLRALKGASIDAGAAPALGANARSQWQGARPRRVGESDVYELVILRNGREVPVPIEGDPQGRAFRFRIRDMIEGAQR